MSGEGGMGELWRGFGDHGSVNGVGALSEMACAGRGPDENQRVWLLDVAGAQGHPKRKSGHIEYEWIARVL